MAPSTESFKDTIFALASGAGRAGVAVIRISGAGADSALSALIKGSLPEFRKTSLRKLYNPLSGAALDQALIIRFGAPASFTGENMVELHTHGSSAVIEAIGTALFGLGLRQAKAGEFTRRAFNNGRMDLTEAEGLADLIDSETEGQRIQALRQMEGGLRGLYERWREAIMDALAAVEGEIDFPDEADVPDKLARRAGAGLDDLVQDLKNTLLDSAKGERIRHGLDVAIIGPPNAGKSTIINQLTNKQAAIVSEEAGTTRDIIEVEMDIAGLPVRICDTAGMRETDNRIEAEGVRRARARAQAADILIAVLDSSKDKLDAIAAEDLGAGDILVFNKSDLAKASLRDVSRETFDVMSLSAREEGGLQPLRMWLEDQIKDRFGVGQTAGLTRARHRACAESCLDSVSRARANLDFAPELAGDDLRAALHAIRELAGEADIEAVLDRVFSRFCIGK